MLLSLHIENFALIDRLYIEFGEGLNILTGSTGAGKSIIVGALDLALGGRGSEEIIRTGESNSFVEAKFRAESRNIQNHVENLTDIMLNDNTIILRREYRRKGGGKAYIGDHPVSLSVLRTCSKYLASIMGQHSHQALLDPATHQGHLDGYAGLGERLSTLKKLYNRAIGLKDRLSYSKRFARELADRIDLLDFQISEIEKANLKPGEEKELREEKKLLDNSLRIREIGEMATSVLLESDNSAAERIGEVERLLRRFEEVGSSMSDILGLINSASDSLKEAVIRLGNLVDGIDDNPERLNEINDRLTDIFRLKKKYSSDIAGILDYAQDSRRELAGLRTKVSDPGDIEKDLRKTLDMMNEVANDISNVREKSKSRLENSILKNLSSMGMAKARFLIEISNVESDEGIYQSGGKRFAGDETGFDKIEFLFCANPGEGLKPLVKIASGGEISRVMLALKNAFLECTGNGCEVFDEIDVGISGDIAAKVARQLKRLSKKHQVICITHLHQIASAANHHFRVSKQKIRDRSVTRVEKLDKEKRIREIAALLSAETVTEKAIAGARELLENAPND